MKVSFCEEMEAAPEKIKPITEKTKWIVAASLLVLFVVLQFVIFRMGYNRGWAEGSEVPPLRIVEQSDEKAMATLAAFMAESASGPDALAQLLANREEGLQWIRNPELKDDVIWGLARELLVERGDAQACEVIRQLVEQGYGQGTVSKWAPRAELAAGVLRARDQQRDASWFYQQAASGYRSAGLAKDETRVQDVLATVLIGQNRLEEAMGVLSRVNELSARNAVARSKTLAAMGRIARTQGALADSRRYFSEAMAIWPGGKTDDTEDMASARICLAEAMMESGREQEAGPLFKSGLDSLKGREGELSFCLSALRGLAQIASSRHDYTEALSWLYQAEGAARGRVGAAEAFWPCLYDQRGWVLFHQAQPEAAIADFSRAVHATASPDARTQANEGIGMAYMELGKAELARKHLAKALELRKEVFADDATSLARVHRNLGMACDLLGDNTEALSQYDQALQAMERAGNASRDPLRIEVLLCKSHTLTELSKWQDAVDTFQVVIPLLEGEARVETLKNLATCYDNLNLRDKGDECWKEAGYPRVASPSRRKR